MSILIGPISQSAYQDWYHDPTPYFRSKLRHISDVMGATFWEAVDGRRYVRLYLWEMGAAEKALRIFQFYPCGGERMWSWRVPELD